MTPRVSVVMPVRNAAATLREALDSTLAQSLRELELLVIDDGSTDGSPELAESYRADDDRVRIVRPSARGIVAALNGGIAAARAEVVARMDADDVMLPERLERQLEYLDRNADIGVVGTQVELFADVAILAGYREYVAWQNACLTPHEIRDNIYVESPFAHPTVMFRKRLIEEAGGYRDGDFPEDYELWLRLNERGVLMAKVPEVLLRWRERADRTSRTDPRYRRDAFDRLRAGYLARDSRLHSPRGVVIWGAGRRTRLRARHLLQHGVRPIAWVDIDPRKIGRHADGAEVVAPDWLDRSGKPFVLVYVTNHGAREEIAQRLHEIGYVRGRDYLAVG